MGRLQLRVNVPTSSRTFADVLGQLAVDRCSSPGGGAYVDNTCDQVTRQPAVTGTACESGPFRRSERGAR